MYPPTPSVFAKNKVQIAVVDVLCPVIFVGTNHKLF